MLGVAVDSRREESHWAGVSWQRTKEFPCCQKSSTVPDSGIISYWLVKKKWALITLLWCFLCSLDEYSASANKMFNSSNLFSVSYKRTAGSEAFVFHASSKWVTAKPPCQDWAPLLLLSFAGCEIIAIRHKGHFNMALVSLIFPHHLCYSKYLHGN